MEVLVESTFWSGKRVLITGHTGFKGAWLSLWLIEMGAEVTGFSLSADQTSLFRQLDIEKQMTHLEGNICDLNMLEGAFQKANPEIIFHLAAQPIVRQSYDEPLETFGTNVLGTANVLDVCRRLKKLRALVAITSDKCYENKEWVWPYREGDPLGGHDPYSASKAAAELVIASYRKSFFGGADSALLASVRAGNVIGGGDWAKDRLVPDIVRSVSAGTPILLRSPNAVRPWQHVLEALGGYLIIAQRLFGGNLSAACAWNFGPSPGDAKPVHWIADRITKTWGKGVIEIGREHDKHEAGMLKLDCSKARDELGWRPAMDLEETIDAIIEWHSAFEEGQSALKISQRQIRDYHNKINALLAESTKYE